MDSPEALFSKLKRLVCHQPLGIKTLYVTHAAQISPIVKGRMEKE